MLNYFLLQLVGPQRKSLSLKDPEKYEFRPKQLLKQVSKKICAFLFFAVYVVYLVNISWDDCVRKYYQIYYGYIIKIGLHRYILGLIIWFLFTKIVKIYVNLARGDKENIFPAAITRDGRSYNEQVLCLGKTCILSF